MELMMMMMNELWMKEKRKQMDASFSFMLPGKHVRKARVVVDCDCLIDARKEGVSCCVALNKASQQIQSHAFLLLS